MMAPNPPLSRAPFAWLRERDIDLLICSELHNDGALRKFFQEKLTSADVNFSGAWVSHAELDGENDLVVSFSSPEGETVALVENKIAASFQPDQAQRYRARALRWAEIEGIENVLTVLCAPKDYMHRPGAELFDVQLSYEDIAAALRSEQDGRARFLAEALEVGVDNYRRGYVPNPNEAVSSMWASCWEIALRQTPKLNFQKPELKPGGSTWFYFRKAEGFSAEDRRAVIVLKGERGEADLQFAGTSVDALRAHAQKYCDALMKIVPAAKSASIRLSVPRIDFYRSASEQQGEILSALDACEKLRLFYCEYQEFLMPKPL